MINLLRQARKVERKSALSAEVHRDGATGVTINVLLSQPTAFTSGGATLNRPLYTRNDHFTKTGSGQTLGKTKKTGVRSPAGTYFEGAIASEGLVVRPGVGHALMHHRAMRHAAYPIDEGLRHVLVVFLEST